MKKKKQRRFLKFAFWGFVAIGIAWLAFAPKPKPQHRAPVQVDVMQPAPVPPIPPMPPQTAVGDEQSQTPAGPVTVPATPPEEKPVVPKGQARIAIVIDDVGLDMRDSRRAVALPSFITLSYIPYSTRLHEQTKEAREAGHELLLHMPMEPMGSADPGPGALLVDLPQEEQRRRLDTALASFTGFDGINNHMGSKFTANAEGMEMVIGELQERHLFFLDSKTSAQSVGTSIAHEHGLPTVSRDVFLDDDMSAKAVRIQLEQTERVARRKGCAIAIGHPHPVTLDVLEAWLPDAEKRGFTFVPINSLVNQPPP